MTRQLSRLVALALLLGGCPTQDEGGESTSPTTSIGSSAASGSEGDESPSAPMTADECYDAFLSKRGDTCYLDDCGEVLSCVNQFDCATCSEQCLPPGCSTDAECQQQFGHLCPGVTWICDQYHFDLACTVDFGGGGGSSGDGGTTTSSGGCAAGDPYECAGAQLYDCATGDYHDCDAQCVAAGWSGAADPPCGVGSDGYELCLCV